MPTYPPGENFAAEAAFPDLRFDQPLALHTPPGETNRLFVVEKSGRIKVISDLQTKPSVAVFLDLSKKVNDVQESGLLDLAFHPGYATNGLFFIVYTTLRTDGNQDWRLARFQCSTNPSAALPASEARLIDQLDSDPYHEGGGLTFGPDGYLYVSIGDGGGSYNSSGQAQRIDRDFFSGIMRLDVDEHPENLLPNPHPSSLGHYRIPVDNPFVGAFEFNGHPVLAEKVRTEFYAVGLRNPFRFSFDPLTGDLYSGDVGQARREEIDWVVKGGNYGWPFEEGLYLHTNVLTAPQPSKSFFIPPIGDYGHELTDVFDPNYIAGGYAITGGLFCRTTSLASLDGCYLFSDFPQGKVGVLRFGSSETAQQLRTLQNRITQIEEELRNNPISLDAEVDWENGWLQQESRWEVVVPQSVSASSGGSLTVLPDSSVYTTEATAWDENYTVVGFTKMRAITGVRLELLPDDTLPEGGPGVSAGGATMLSEMTLEVDSSDLTRVQQAKWGQVLADFSQLGYEAGKAADQDPLTAWGISPLVGEVHTAIFQADQPLGFEDGASLYFGLEQAFGNSVNIGRFRLSITEAPAPLSLDPTPPQIAEMLRIPRSDRTSAQQNSIWRYYRTIDPARQQRREELEGLYADRANLLRTHQTQAEWLLNQASISSFGIHPGTKEILMTDLLEGKILRLAAREPDGQPPLPPTLADTGIFQDLASLTPNPGVYPFQINQPFWSDGAKKTRWFALPTDSSVMVAAPADNWEFPPGAIWVKHFDIAVPGKRSAQSVLRRLETRVLVRNGTGVYGVTYRWEGTNAYLVNPDGFTENIVTQTGGIIRTQAWRYPSRSDCLRCHTPLSGYALGFNTAQLNRPSDAWGSGENQLDVLSRSGFLLDPLTNVNNLASLVELTDTRASRDYRVKSFLQANCAQCHQPGGIGGGLWDARITTPMNAAGIIDGPLSEALGNPANRVVAPGSLENSILYQRLARLDSHHMPPLGTSVLNDDVIQLLADWITHDLPSRETYMQWAARVFAPLPDANPDPDGDEDQDGIPNEWEYLMGTDPLNPNDTWNLSVARSWTATEISFYHPPNVTMQVEWAPALGLEQSWVPLTGPDNRPFYTASGMLWVVRDVDLDQPTRFYRVRASQP